MRQSPCNVRSSMRSAYFMRHRILGWVVVTAFLLGMLSCGAAAAESDIYENNLKQTSAWVNPGDYLDELDPSDPADQYLMELSNSIVGSETDPRRQLEEIYSWVTDHIYYDYVAYDAPITATYLTEEDNAALVEEGFYYTDSNGDRIGLASAPVMTAVLRRGVCSDYASLLAHLLRAQGIPCIVVRGYADNSHSATMEHSESHAWNAAYLDGEWLYLDSTWDSGNRYVNGSYLPGTSSKTYFCISLEALSRDHYFTEFGKTRDNDIPSAWAQRDVAAAITAGLVPYALQGAYRDEISRQEFCQLIIQAVRVMKPELLSNLDVSQSPFSDVTDTAVTAADQLGIVQGTGGTLFTPNRDISRQEAAVMLSRLTVVLGFQTTPAVSAPAFTDMGKIASWAQTSVAEVTAMGIMNGTGSAFDPHGTYTIEQAIATVCRVHALL